jgi:hypothetical protein
MDRITLERIEEDLDRLRQAVNDAQVRGDPLARSLRTGMWIDMLEDLAAYFETGEIRPSLPQRRRPKK